MLSRNAADLFAKLVRPQHTLIFPYPSQGLPKAGIFIRGLGNIHANRANQAPRSLSDMGNAPMACVLEIGQESHEIRLLSPRERVREEIPNPWDFNIDEIS